MYFCCLIVCFTSDHQTFVVYSWSDMSMSVCFAVWLIVLLPTITLFDACFTSDHQPTFCFLIVYFMSGHHNFVVYSGSDLSIGVLFVARLIVLHPTRLLHSSHGSDKLFGVFS